MFKVVCHSKIAIGHLYESDTHLVFFGNALGSPERIRESFPHLTFLSVKQVHSNTWVRASVTETVADAHYTTAPGEALLIKTADCLPVMAVAPGFAAAIHAGWRGLAAGIIRGLALVSDRPSWDCGFVGPHISRQRYEVGREVEQQFRSALDSISISAQDVFLPHSDPRKVFLDLGLVARRQLQSVGIQKILNVEYDTFSLPSYHSFRRDAQSAGRQLSFVCIKPSVT